jgi:SPP1 family predicted phage head-tail adaptor
MTQRLITIERPVQTRETAFGSISTAWEPLVGTGSPVVAEKFWAEVDDVPPSRSEAVRQGLQQARNQVRIRIRWRSDVDSSMRVTVHGDVNVVYQIVGGPAEIGGRKRRLEMVCERYSTAGNAS